MTFIKLLGVIFAIVSANPEADLSADDLRELLKASMQNTISLTSLAEKQTGKMTEVMNILVEAKEEMKDLKHKLSESDYKLETVTNELEKARRDVFDLKKQVASSTNDIAVLDEQHTQIKEVLSSSKEDLSNEIDVLREHTGKASKALNDRVDGWEGIKRTWPEGKYCIFANGGCPPNFTRQHGFLNAIAVFSSTRPSYMRQNKFGSSQIRCHWGNNCSKSPKWADLHIVTCCK